MKRITCSALNMMNVPGWNDLINGNIVICSSGACCKLLLSHLQGYDQRRRGLEDWQNQSLSQGTLGVIFLCTNLHLSVYIPVNLISKGIKVIFVIILNIHYRSKVGGQKDFYLKKLILFQQGCIKLIKSHSKDIYNVTKISIALSILIKQYHSFHKKTYNNKKCSLNIKSAYWNDF